MLVDFLNPETVVLGGRLSLIEPLTQNLRAALYARALPLSISELAIDTTITAENASCLGAAWTIIDHLFSVGSVNADVLG